MSRRGGMRGPLAADLWTEVVGRERGGGRGKLQVGEFWVRGKEGAG